MFLLPPLMKILTSYILITLYIIPLCQAQQSDPTQFNGGSILAMAGRNSVAIAIDARFGLGMQTVSAIDGSFGRDRLGGSASGVGGRILLLPNSNVLLAWTGLYGDGMGFAEEMSVLLARKVRRSGCMGFQSSVWSNDWNRGGLGRKMSPRAISMLMSHLLYRRRSAPYYVEPVVVGLETVRVPVLEGSDLNAANVPDANQDTIVAENVDNENHSYKQIQSMLQLQTSQQQKLASTPQQKSTIPRQRRYRTYQKPYLCTMDMLGAQSTSNSFVCSGVASRSLHGTAEALWKPNLEGEELVEVCGRAFVSALERDCLSGYGAVVYLIQCRGVVDGSSDGGTENDVVIMEYVLACRND